MSVTIRSFLVIILASIIFQSCSVQKKLDKVDDKKIANIKNHVSFLSDDKLEGRRAGTAGEQLAMQYIKNVFEKAGLEEKGTDGFYQPFPIHEGKEIKASSFLSINDNHLEVEKDFFPLAFSPNIQINALQAISLHEYGMPWFIDLADVLEENKSNPHFDITEFIKNKISQIEKKGATLLILYNGSKKDDQLVFDSKDKTANVSIPVIYIQKEAAKKYLNDITATLDINLKIDIGEKSRTGHNVIGYINNEASTTIILGAHFDHLGYGEDGNSMHRTGEKLIHNGADDNASGTAALLELASSIKKSNNKNHNYLFIAFSGEELGLFGSKYFVDNIKNKIF